MNRLLVEFSNGLLLLPESAGGEVLAALMGAAEVTSHGYGDDTKFTESSHSSLSIKRVPARQFVADTTDALRLELAEAKASASTSNAEWWKEYTARQAVEQKLKELQPTAEAP
jgi:hypothetical protein